MIYLTYNDPPSGIYYSQVSDVCDFLNKKFNSHIRLVSVISIRNFWQNRQKIKLHSPAAIVIPMFPGVENWKWNFIFLFFIFIFLDSKKVIARGAFAAALALSLRKTGIIKWICFDARGAYDAELNEYNVIKSEKIKKNIFEIEKNAVSNSDFRIAVSNELVSYWKDNFAYQGANHVVIPCLLNSKLFNLLPQQGIVNKNKSLLGFSHTDIVLVYSGSTAGWQSLEIIDEFLHDLFKCDQNIKVLFLAEKMPDKMKIFNEFKHRIVCKWLKEAEVPAVLSCCDYGILIRKRSVTNKVSSPVKFAEYLACGLKVLISEEIGDYSEFVIRNDCGIIIRNAGQNIHLPAVAYEEKQRINSLALHGFSKDHYSGEYKKIVG